MLLVSNVFWMILDKIYVGFFRIINSKLERRQIEIHVLFKQFVIKLDTKILNSLDICLRILIGIKHKFFQLTKFSPEYNNLQYFLQSANDKIYIYYEQF